jgi:ABC-type multidrug transport system ATPase subunit
MHEVVPEKVGRESIGLIAGKSIAGRLGLRMNAAGVTVPVLMEVKRLTKGYGDQKAITDISFTVDAGEVLGLIGPNGAGKTTLLQATAGTVAADGGEILWRGMALPLPRRREFLFYLPDGVRPWEDQYVARVVELFAGIYDRSEAFLAETIRSLGLGPVLRKRIAALSKGYGRRLLLALALLTPHPLLMMDEPFDGFDLRQTRDIMKILREVAGNGRTLVLAIHQLGDAARVCDRFVLLAEGRVRGIGTLAELRVQTGKPAAGLEDVFLALT